MYIDIQHPHYANCLRSVQKRGQEAIHALDKEKPKFKQKRNVGGIQAMFRAGIYLMVIVKYKKATPTARPAN